MPRISSFPNITVVIHTFNQEQFIGGCLKGVISQDLINQMKILVIDDCSTDDTLKVCYSFQRRFPRNIEVVALPKNEFSQGLHVGNDYMRRIDTKYIAWCDGDDYWTDITKIKKQFLFLEENPEVGIVHTDYLYSRQNSKDVGLTERSQSEKNKAAKALTGKDLVNGNPVKNSTAMMLYEAIDFEFVGASRKIFAADWLIAVSVARKLNIHFMPDRTAVVRVSEQGIWNGNNFKTNNMQKAQVRWYCAAQLPESQLRDVFRRKVVVDWIREKIATSRVYRLFRPLVFLGRRVKSICSKLKSSRTKSY